jgi:ubiquitin carboxyl-terminal hydrolase 1
MKLNHPSYYGKHIWTPTKLKSMNSWAQQDAQEYFSKISEDIDKEIQALARRHAQSEMDLARCLSFIDAEVNPEGHNGPKGCEQEPGKTVRPDSRNPFEGAVASRVACLKCGNTDGLSLSPFICLTLALGTELETDLKACLNGYSELETINGVECARCTLERRKLKTETALQKLADTQTERTPAMDKLEESLSTHLATLEECLEADDISNKLVSEKCRIPKDQYVASEKTKQMVIARAPNSLVIHINRSMIDMYTGMLRKNSARVRFPTRFDLGPWCLGSGTDSDSSNATADTWSMDPTVSLVGRSSEKTAAGYNLYELRSLVAHYGRHENGHFVCFRKFSTSNDGIFRSDVPDAKADCSKQSINREEERWWCLNDETVTPVEEDLVLQQSGAFLLFYERIKDNHSWSAPNGTAQAKTSPVADQEDENHIADTTQLIDADIDAKDHHLTQTSLSANDPLPNGSSSPTHTSPPPSSAASGDRVNLRTKSNPLSINGADQDDPALPASEQRISTESLSLSSKTTDAAASHKSSVSIQSSSIAAN